MHSTSSRVCPAARSIHSAFFSYQLRHQSKVVTIFRFNIPLVRQIYFIDCLFYPHYTLYCQCFLFLNKNTVYTPGIRVKKIFLQVRVHWAQYSAQYRYRCIPNNYYYQIMINYIIPTYTYIIYYIIIIIKAIIRTSPVSSQLANRTLWSPWWRRLHGGSCIKSSASPLSQSSCSSAPWQCTCWSQD